MIPLCSSCALVTKLIGTDKYEPVDKLCALCFGILSDVEFRRKVVDEIKNEYEKSGYDSLSVVIAISTPVSMFLREFVIAQLFEDTWDAKQMNAKNIFSNLLQRDIERDTPLKGSINSDLVLTVVLENEEFANSDVDYLTRNFSKHFVQRKRRNYDDDPVKSMYTRVKIQEIGSSSMTKKLAKKVVIFGYFIISFSEYKFEAPTKPCTFSICFERAGIYIGGRYCKFSRALPQSPWTTDIDIPAKADNSVSEKIGNVMKRFCKASSVRFISSGREDIDVRMLGDGRPFAIQIVNARIAECFRRDKLDKTLQQFQDEINKDSDIFVSRLAKVTSQQAEKLNVGAEEKRKLYSALCYSTVSLTKEALDKLESCTPLTIKQTTVIRVLKRRPLHDRLRDIYKMRVFWLDEYHFLLRLETQAGTYIKEFVHGDFGRTTPSVGEILGIGADKVGILELDVEAVYLDWPPNLNTTIPT